MRQKLQLGKAADNPPMFAAGDELQIAESVHMEAVWSTHKKSRVRKEEKLIAQEVRYDGKFEGWMVAFEGKPNQLYYADFFEKKVKRPALTADPDFIAA